MTFTLTFKTIADATGITALAGGLKNVETQAKETAAAVNSANNASGGGAAAERDAAIQARALVLQREKGLTAENSLRIAQRQIVAEEAQVAALAKQAALRAENLAAQEAQAAVSGSAGGNLASATSLLAGPVGIAATVAYGLYNIIASASDASLQLARDIEKGTEELEKQVTQWIHLAEAARTTADVANVGEKVATGLEAASAKLSKLQQQFQDLGPLQKLWGFLNTPIGDASGLQKSIDAQKDLVQETLKAGAKGLQIAQDAKATWDSVQFMPLIQAVDVYTQKLERLKADRAAINPFAPDALRSATELDQKIVVAEADLKKLTDQQQRLARESENLALAIKKADFSQLDPQNKLAAANADMAVINERMRALGIEVETPNELLELMKGKTEAEQQEVLKLAGDWRQVIAEMGQASAAISNLAAQRQGFEDKLNLINAQASGSREEIYKAEWGKRYNEVLHERERLGKDISADLINQDVYNEKLAKENVKALAEQDRDTKKIGSSTREVSQEKSRLTLIEQGYNTEIERTKLLEEAGLISAGEAQRRKAQATAAYIVELQRAREELLQLIAKEEALGHTGGADQLRQKYEQLTNAILKAKIAAQGQDTSFFGQIRGQLKQLVSDWGNAGKQMAGFLTGTLNTAVNSTSQAITGLIFRTKNWKQAFAQAAQSIVGNLIQILLQMTIGKAIGSVLSKLNVTEQTAAGAAIASANAPAAAATSIASYGGSAVAGGAAAAVAIASIIGALVGGFEQGGWTGGEEGKPAGIVHGKEVVFPAQRVRDFGRDFLVNMAVGSLSRPNYHNGGGSGFGGGSAPGKQEVHVFNFTNPDQLRDAVLKSDAAQKIIIDTVNGRRIDLGLS